MQISPRPLGSVHAATPKYERIIQNICLKYNIIIFMDTISPFNMLNSLGFFKCFLFYMETKYDFMVVFVSYVEEKTISHELI